MKRENVVAGAVFEFPYPFKKQDFVRGGEERSQNRRIKAALMSPLQRDPLGETR